MQDLEYTACQIAARAFFIFFLDIVFLFSIMASEVFKYREGAWILKKRSLCLPIPPDMT